MASKKVTRNHTARKNASNHKKAKETVKHNEQVQEEIILIVTLVISILIFLSYFNLSGIVGKYVSGFLFGIIGLEAYILPFILFFGTAFRISNLGNRAAGRKLLSAAVFLIALAALIQLICEPYNESTKIFEYFINSSKERSGGGIIGGILVMMLCGAFDVTATYIILIAVMTISLIVITGKALFLYIAKKSRGTLKERKQVRMQRKAEEIEESDVETEVPRRKFKTFELQTESNAANQDEPAKVVSLSARKSKKLSKQEIDELPIVNLDHLFIEEENKTGMSMADEFNSASEAGQVITYEDELKNKFEKANNTAEESFIDEVYNDTYNDKEIFSADNYNNDEYSTKVEQPTQSLTSSKADEKTSSTQVEKLDISQEADEKEYVFPPVDLLTPPKPRAGKGLITEKTLKETAAKLQSTLESFGVHVTVTNVSCGPTVTRYELQPEQGVKVKSITSLADDIKLNLAAAEVRIEAPIPGKSAVGIEVPNKENSVVTFRELIESKEFTSHPSDLAFAVGRDIGGQIVVTDIAKMPHLLIAGATGSGKSVCINTLIMSILYKSKPSDVRMIMVDPKVVELNVYNGIPHLLIPVVTDPKKAAAALNWAVIEMTDRYKKFAEMGVRDLKGYNEKIKELADEENYKKLPQIIIIIDELADLMMVAPSEVEDSICRLAQMARAAGIHLIIATQRPSVNVITGLIKANIPSRIAFAVSSAVDSRTIIDGSGAEKLLGKGDMLFFPSGYPKPVRIQGSYVSEKEVSAVVDYIIKNNSGANYSEEVDEKIATVQAGDSGAAMANDRDEFFVDAGRFIIEKDKASIGMLQREFRIGFNRAARIMDQLASVGVVGPEEGTKPRKILMTMEEYEQFLADNGLI
ncbi:S-DNA-T family DNA segregation ATPase FtsK/SpoIIIE [Herbinix hemicellulosilytica]|uniref:FtsK domain-containing protein n=1 Tax=Herbinix hemicellulosilytica TaxID=1564487 RepID=A0A0H5SHY9_HERHM|nr:DNA translocase FtsK [Herbinix hemicellulosilytica]RBP60739.1 S-DNA-T family DNA segregation ATPase FtsK/SpoIIIE [Herbinix hemicellulosilytica]CRZ34426.1 hypothetical protein HHT355_1224 [Herbinix hemicellulosilytica]